MTPAKKALAWQNQLADRTDRDGQVYLAGILVGAAHEREECAKIVKQHEDQSRKKAGHYMHLPCPQTAGTDGFGHAYMVAVAQDIFDAIRARGKA